MTAIYRIVNMGVDAAVNMKPFIIMYLQSRCFNASKSFETYHTTTVNGSSISVSFQLLQHFLPESGEGSGIDRLADLRHQIVVKIEIVHDAHP